MSKGMGKEEEQFAFNSDTFFAVGFRIKEKLQAIFSGVCDKHGLNMFQVRILIGIDEGESDTVGGFADCFGANQGNVSTVCKKLANEGLITRTRSREDERVVLLELTPAGKEKIAAIKATFDSLSVRVGESAEPGEVEALMKGIAAFEKFVNYVITDGV